jgi:glutamyl-tRNA reductase
MVMRVPEFTFAPEQFTQLLMIRDSYLEQFSFFAVGINYKKSDASVRGMFSVTPDQYKTLLTAAGTSSITEVFVLSTCNRTEIYGLATDASELAKLLCTYTEGSLEEFNQMAYTHRGENAIDHLFSVAAGLDSQILGDYEIIGQIKVAAKLSKSEGRIGPFLERLLNEVLQCSKKIRTVTSLSSGTVSVSFAAVQYCKDFFQTVVGKKLLLIGTGKIGTNTCKNIVDYLPGCTTVLMNRTLEKASQLANQYNLQYAAADDLQNQIETADIVIVAANADEPVITEAMVSQLPAKLFIDLSVPFNIEPSISEIIQHTLVNIDQLSRIKDETLEKRKLEIPKARAIIEEHIANFTEWLDMRRHVPVLRAVKSHLLKIHSSAKARPLPITPVASLCDKSAEEKIQKLINGMAVKMRSKDQRGCQYIEVMHDFIATGSL